MIAAGLSGVLHVVQPSSGKELATLPSVAGSLAAIITDDGTRFAVQAPNGSVEIRSLADGRTLYRFAMRPLVPEIDLESSNISYHFIGQLWDLPDRLLVTGFLDPKGVSAIATWDIHLETRTPAEIGRLVAERVSWRLDGGRLIPRDRAWQ